MRFRNAFILSLRKRLSREIQSLLTGGPGYSGFEGYRHKVIISRRNKSASDLLPGVHRVASLLKRWLMGTHQGAVSHDHLGYYLDEFTFRFNRRTSSYRGKFLSTFRAGGTSSACSVCLNYQACPSLETWKTQCVVVT